MTYAQQGLFCYIAMDMIFATTNIFASKLYTEEKKSLTIYPYSLCQNFLQPIGLLSVSQVLFLYVRQEIFLKEIGMVHLFYLLKA